MASKGRCVKKRSRKALTLNKKLEMITLGEKGFTMTEIGRKLGLARQTVSTIVNAKEKVLDQVKSSTPLNTKVIRKRDGLIADMEKVLLVWIEKQSSQNLSLTRGIIQDKALSIFNSMKAERGEKAAEDTFEASRGWFQRFKDRCQLSNKVDGEIVSAGGYQREIARIIECGKYTKHQIFNVDEIALYWKKMPSRTFIAKEEKSMHGFKAGKDRLTLLLGVNAAGDCKLKPMMIYHSENPGALKNYVKGSLPVCYRYNSKACMTGELFINWFTDYFKPTVEAYCKKNNIPFKILLIADSAPCHPRALIGMYQEIKVVLMPENTPSLLQPMEQGLIAAFKSYYLRSIFTEAVNALDSDTVLGPKQNKLKAFWKDFTILDGIKSVRDAWEEVKEITLKGVWTNLIPHLSEDFEGFENLMEEVTTDVVEMARELDLEVKAEDVEEWLRSHDETLTDREFFLIEKQRKKFCEEELHTDDSLPFPREMASKELKEAFNYIEMAMATFERIDPNFERSSKVNAALLNGIACYKEILRERRQSIRQNSLLFFKKVPSQPSTATASLEQPPTSKSTATASLEQPSTSTASLEQPSTSTASLEQPSTSTASLEQPSTSTATASREQPPRTISTATVSFEQPPTTVSAATASLEQPLTLILTATASLEQPLILTAKQTPTRASSKSVPSKQKYFKPGGTSEGDGGGAAGSVVLTCGTDNHAVCNTIVEISSDDEPSECIDGVSGYDLRFSTGGVKRPAVDSGNPTKRLKGTLLIDLTQPSTSSDMPVAPARSAVTSATSTNISFPLSAADKVKQEEDFPYYLEIFDPIKEEDSVMEAPSHTINVWTGLHYNNAKNIIDENLKVKEEFVKEEFYEEEIIMNGDTTSTVLKHRSVFPTSEGDNAKNSHKKGTCQSLQDMKITC
ncbi:tigger transposable element-derived protein 1 isoform X2 [Cherax quadricarinatus]|uniref:tigger transposable element-derived protein 1 isoform X2 n=1 Tax=Cherax quadricarinatus TaxID=27406 RepID=UPI00387E26DE